MSAPVLLPPAFGVGNLNTLLKRLEAATSRLEDIAMSQVATSAPTNSASNSHPFTAPVQPPAAGPPPPAHVLEAPPAVLAYDAILAGPLAAFLAHSKDLGGVVAEQAAFVSKAFQAQRAFIQFTSACTKLPSSSPAFGERLGPTAHALTAGVELKDKHRGSKEESNLLSTVSEGLPALAWVQVEPKPGPHIGDARDSAQFWANRVVKDNKESNPKAVEWARSWIAVLEELRKYVMQFHTTGLSWNPRGADPLTYKFPSTATSAGAPPPPPPPPAPSSSTFAPAPKAAAPAGDMGSVFASLNKGEAVTKGLKKVDKSEMTHKNPELRASSVVGAVGAVSTSHAIAKGPVKPPKPHSFQKKPPKTELEGKKWTIENHENNSSILINETEISQLVDIFNVKSSVIHIKGKVNAVSLVNCSKVSLLLDSVVASLAISASPSFTVQILGKVPTILIDGTDGGQIYLSRESLDVEIVTAKSSSINVSLPVEGEEEGVFEEKAVPEQLKTVVKDGKLYTIVVEHSG